MGCGGALASQPEGKSCFLIGKSAANASAIPCSYQFHSFLQKRQHHVLGVPAGHDAANWAKSPWAASSARSEMVRTAAKGRAVVMAQHLGTAAPSISTGCANVVPGCAQGGAQAWWTPGRWRQNGRRWPARPWCPVAPPMAVCFQAPGAQRAGDAKAGCFQSIALSAPGQHASRVRA